MESSAPRPPVVQGASPASPTASATIPSSPTASPAPPAHGAQGAPGAQGARVGVRRDRSSLSRRAVDDGEESDWDQYSSENADLNDSDNNRGPTRQVSALAKAAITAEVEQANFIRETDILRIDKVKGCVFVNKYLVVKFLGRGACGKVFLCLNTHDLCLYAMKAVRKVDLASTQPTHGKAPRNPMDDLKREIMIMKKMKHENIVTLSEVIDDPAGSKLMLVMEYLDRGPVLTREALERRERLPEPMARHYFRDMIKALDYLHAHKIVHGDLKPENVLLGAAGNVKLSDFGCSKVFATGNEYLDRCNGTPAFLAPEMMKPNTKYRGRPTDIYALGACLYTLLFGRIPFSAPSLYKLFEVVQKEPVKYPEDVPISDSLKQVLGRMLTKSPKERISLQELMRHPWVTMDGRFPIKSYRDLKPGETNEIHDGLIDGVSYDQANPRPRGLPDLSHLSNHEKVFNAGEIIMQQGEIGVYALYIVKGTADILVKWGEPPKSSHRVGVNGSTSTSNDEFMDESETMSPITDEASRDNRLKLLRASVKAQDFVKKLQEAGAGTGPCANNLLIAQRGPGELLGDMALFRRNKTRCATVRCRTDLTVRVVLKDQLFRLMSENTVVKLLIRESILSKESEITMVDSLVKLANSCPVIAASLEAVWNSSHLEGARSHAHVHSTGMSF